MSTIKKSGLLAVVVAMGTGQMVAGEARAQAAGSAPDAGRILREQPAPAKPALAHPPTPSLDAPAVDAGQGGPRVRVKSVRVTGATLVPAAELEARLSGLIGVDATFVQLQAAAMQISAGYAERGYLARVILPPQDVVDGRIEFQVVEGTRGELSVDRRGERIDAERVRAFVDHRIARGAPMDVGALGEALSILNEQPGADVSVSLSTGASESAVDLRVAAQDRPLLSGFVVGSNQASRGVGTAQVVGSLSVNNPTGRFDVASVLLSAAEGTAYVRGDYGSAVGNAGTRVHVHAAHLTYRLVQDSFRALEAEGTARTLGLTGSHPIRRRATSNVSLSAGLEHKRMADETVAGETGRRVINVATAGLSGNAVLGAERWNGEFSYGAGLTSGDVDQRNAAALAADQAGRRTNGSFWKFNLNAQWRQAFAGGWLLSVAGRCQRADGNVDSSEQFFLGGVGGVRAYPIGEASGDEGWVVNLEFTRRLNERLTVGAFADGGEITLNHTPAAGVAGTPNRYGLAGAGLSLDWQVASRAAVRVMVAKPLGNNPAARTTGNDADGRNSGSTRLWASLATQF